MAAFVQDSDRAVVSVVNKLGRGDVVIDKRRGGWLGIEWFAPLDTQKAGMRGLKRKIHGDGGDSERVCRSHSAKHDVRLLVTSGKRYHVINSTRII